ncbi:hypothetical protein GCM10020221_25770 [Streptomyces thioluteus]|uniref:Uncharacterized protein n=1 Tax=Streptomyces thioluteus TaxID=66431 RepID=A0ABN3WYB8_STRTU
MVRGTPMNFLRNCSVRNRAARGRLRSILLLAQYRNHTDLVLGEREDRDRGTGADAE